jgi:hypothetical protein
VTKSTVPIGTGDEVERIIRETRPGTDFAVVSNPEFLREGAAIRDFKIPDRIVIGSEDPRAREVAEDKPRALPAGCRGQPSVRSGGPLGRPAPDRRSVRSGRLPKELMHSWPRCMVRAAVASSGSLGRRRRVADASRTKGANVAVGNRKVWDFFSWGEQTCPRANIGGWLQSPRLLRSTSVGVP